MQPFRFIRSTVRVALITGSFLAGCASGSGQHSSAMLYDAQQCDADATGQIGPHGDPGVRRLLIESCMALRGWSERQ